VKGSLITFFWCILSNFVDFPFSHPPQIAAFIKTSKGGNYGSEKSKQKGNVMSTLERISFILFIAESPFGGMQEAIIMWTVTTSQLHYHGPIMLSMSTLCETFFLEAAGYVAPVNTAS